MAQTNFTPISLYYSATATSVPTAGNLVAGELAINTNDGKLFYKDSSGVVQTLASKAGALGDVVGPASATDNAVSRFDATTGKLIQNSLVTISDTGAISAPVDASISGLTVGKGGGAVSTNTALGNGALTSSNTGLSSVFGYQAGFGATGAALTAIGYQAGYSNTDGNGGVFVGYQSGKVNTTGEANVGVGANSLLANTTGSFNVSIGKEALRSNTTASNNTAIGYQSLYSNTTTGNNTAVGYRSAYNNTTGGGIHAFGYQALQANTTGQSNSAFGGTYNANAALLSNTTGSYNSAFGEGALSANTTASNNTAVGYQAGSNITTGSYNVYIGNAISASSATSQAEIVIAGSTGTTGKGTSTGYINAGGGGVYQGNNSATWSITSDSRLKKNIVNNNEGLGIVSQIQVRNFEYRTKDEVTELPQNQAVTKSGVQLGVIAQELQQVCPDCVTEQSTGVLSVNTDEIFWHLVNAVKELKTEVDSLKQQLGK
jgi:hypothetical protein